LLVSSQRRPPRVGKGANSVTCACERWLRRARRTPLHVRLPKQVRSGPATRRCRRDGEEGTRCTSASFLSRPGPLAPRESARQVHGSLACTAGLLADPAPAPGCWLMPARSHPLEACATRARSHAPSARDTRAAAAGAPAGEKKSASTASSPPPRPRSSTRQPGCSASRSAKRARRAAKHSGMPPTGPAAYSTCAPAELNRLPDAGATR